MLSANTLVVKYKAHFLHPLQMSWLIHMQKYSTQNRYSSQIDVHFAMKQNKINRGIQHNKTTATTTNFVILKSIIINKINVYRIVKAK